MKFVIQRVNYAQVKVNGEIIGKIKNGLVVFIGVSEFDTMEIADKLIKKLIGLRIFQDQNGKTNLDIKSVTGEMLLISQFTLYANCKKGNRPSFIEAGNPELANRLYEYIIAKIKESGVVIATGEFGADMKVELENDGPFTIILDSSQL